MLYETRLLRNGIVCRKICFYQQPKDFVVFEQERREDLLTGQVTWENVYIINCPSRNYARTCYVGRIAAAAYEEGGIADHAAEEREKAIHNSMASPIGKHPNA